MATISSLYTGATILLEESSGTYATYEIVQFDYNDGIALLWRNKSIGNTQWRTTSVSAAETLYQGSNLDNYIISWYQSLPISTRNILSAVNYPVASANSSSSTQAYISRYAATVSGYEIGSSQTGYGFYGEALDYYYAPLEVSYWTRQPYNGVALALGYSVDTSAVAGFGPTSALGVRPTVGVDQDLEATWDDDLGGYKLSVASTATPCTAPTTLYLNGGAYNYGSVTTGQSFTLSWDAVTGDSVYGYSVYYSTSENGTYTWMKDVTGTSTTVYAPDTYSTYRYFKVQTMGTDSSLNSALSTAYRRVYTRASPENLCSPPETLYLNDSSSGLTNVALGAEVTLSWDAAAGAVSSYYVYYKDSVDSSWLYVGNTTSLSMAVTAPSVYSASRYFSVMVSSSVLGGDSGFSNTITLTTKAETVNYGISYYDGTQWLYPTPLYYNGSGWVRPTMWYYNGSTWLPIPPRTTCSATVEAVSGATHGFEINDNGYHESQNKGVGSSYALCKVKIVTDGTQAVYVDCINYAESGYDYGMLSKVDTALSLSIGADSTDKVQRTFSGSHSASVQTVDYGVLSAGEHYIYVKYIKDSRDDYNNDSLQFKVRFGSSSSECSATVASVSGAYSFAMNGSGYYESTNKGDDYHGTYALCRVNIVADGVKRMYVDYINYGENGWDYGLISKLDTTLGADDTKTSTNIHESFVVASNSSVQTLDYGVLSAGEHYIYAKYLKDGSYNNGSDSLQFKVRFV